MKALMIINPKAGRSNRRKTAEYLRRVFRFHGYDCDVMTNAKPREAESIARSMAEKYPLVICTGGDGTLNETVNGMTGLQNRPPLAYLPTGTTNDFAESVGLSTDISQAIRDALDGTREKLDIGKINGRCFVYVASFGAFSESAYQTPQNMKNRLGRLAYFLECVRELPSIKAHRIRVYDGQREVCRGSYIFGAVSNAVSIGGVLRYNRSDVDFSDGMHEVLLIKKPESAGMFRRTVRALITGDYASDGIEAFRAKQVRFESEDETAWTVDGERCKPAKTAEIKNIPYAMEFILPKQLPSAS